MNSQYLQTKHLAGMSFEKYIHAGTPQQTENWQKIYTQAALTPAQKRLVGGFTRKINIIGLSGIWCGDCAQQCPLVERIAEANPTWIDLRWLERDAHLDLQVQVRICGGQRVPVFLFCAEDYELVGWYGDRTISRYRAIAQRQLGPSCPLPGAPVEQAELAATLHDWLTEIERVHLVLRVSPRLRKLHGD